MMTREQYEELAQLKQRVDECRAVLDAIEERALSLIQLKISPQAHLDTHRRFRAVEVHLSEISCDLS